MSKVVDSLKRHIEPTRKNGHSTELKAEKTTHELTQEQLASIYFSNTSKGRQEQPVIIKVIEKPRMASVIPWIIASIAFLITALSLFSTKRVFVDIKVIDERLVNTYQAQLQRLSEIASTPIPAPKQEEPASEAPEALPPPLHQEPGTALSLNSFVFEGAAYLKSSRDESMLTLVNSSISTFARASLTLDPPIDMVDNKIVFYVRGSRGGEDLAVALKDYENIQAFPRGKIFPFEKGMTNQWQKVEIVLAETAQDFNGRQVVNLRFEFGSKDTKNKPGDTIFIKDLRVVPV